MRPSDLLEKCHFVPFKTMKKVLEFAESSDPIRPNSTICRRNLANVQATRTTCKVLDLSLVPHVSREVHQIAIWKAIYSQNWNKLLYLLKKCPPWEHNIYNKYEISVMYYRALTILLMYHPTAQALGLYNDFLHMVFSCRTDQDKKAVLKIVLSLPEKIYGSIGKGRKKWTKEEDEP